MNDKLALPSCENKSLSGDVKLSSQIGLFSSAQMEIFFINTNFLSKGGNLPFILGSQSKLYANC